jgi:hypothetical protein
MAGVSPTRRRLRCPRHELWLTCGSCGLRFATSSARICTRPRMSRPRYLRGQTFGTQAGSARFEPVRRQRRHRTAPALERLPMHPAVERITAARAARAAFRSGSGRFHKELKSIGGTGQEMMPRLASPRESSIRLVHNRHSSALSSIVEQSCGPVARCAKPAPPAGRATIENPVAARQSCTIRPVLTVPCLSLPPCPSFPTFRRSRPP